MSESFFQSQKQNINLMKGGFAGKISCAVLSECISYNDSSVYYGVHTLLVCSQALILVF